MGRHAVVLAAAAVAAALAPAAAATEGAEVVEVGQSGCPPPSKRPSVPPYATYLNGIAWPEMCFERRDAEEHFFIIGDWGGIFRGPDVAPTPADDGRRASLAGVDDRAQALVAEQLKRRANISQPRYIINVGDNFYWGGVDIGCGSRMDAVAESTTSQWGTVFERMYDGPHLKGVPWLGVLGNHDFGGYMFTKGWDQAIAYTWGPGSRWVTPALYWSLKTRYPDFVVDWFFVDSNVNDAFPPAEEPGHNICSLQNNPPNATCGEFGPQSVDHCLHWFQRLWEDEVVWLEALLAESTADWRVVVTHFPPEWQSEVWVRLSERYAIDLIISGHRHQQEVHYRGPLLGNTTWVVSGGGGGILSEGHPTLDGNDDQYGFMDVAISRDSMRIEAVSHSGSVRSSTRLAPLRPPPRRRREPLAELVVGTGANGTSSTSAIPEAWANQSDRRVADMLATASPGGAGTTTTTTGAAAPTEQPTVVSAATGAAVACWPAFLPILLAGAWEASRWWL